MSDLGDFEEEALYNSASDSEDDGNDSVNDQVTNYHNVVIAKDMQVFVRIRNVVDFSSYKITDKNARRACSDDKETATGIKDGKLNDADINDDKESDTVAAPGQDEENGHHTNQGTKKKRPKMGISSLVTADKYVTVREKVLLPKFFSAYTRELYAEEYSIDQDDGNGSITDDPARDDHESVTCCCCFPVLFKSKKSKKSRSRSSPSISSGEQLSSPIKPVEASQEDKPAKRRGPFSRLFRALGFSGPS